MRLVYLAFGIYQHVFFKKIVTHIVKSRIPIVRICIISLVGVYFVLCLWYNCLSVDRTSTSLQISKTAGSATVFTVCHYCFCRPIRSVPCIITIHLANKKATLCRAR